MHKLSLNCTIIKYHEQNYRKPKDPQSSQCTLPTQPRSVYMIEKKRQIQLFYFFFSGFFSFFFSFFLFSVFWTDWGHGEVFQDGLGNGRTGEALRIISFTQFSSFQDSIYMLGQAHVNTTPGLPALPLKWIQCTVTPYHLFCSPTLPSKQFQYCNSIQSTGVQKTVSLSCNPGHSAPWRTLSMQNAEGIPGLPLAWSVLVLYQVTCSTVYL